MFNAIIMSISNHLNI